MDTISLKLGVRLTLVAPAQRCPAAASGKTQGGAVAKDNIPQRNITQRLWLASEGSIAEASDIVEPCYGVEHSGAAEMQLHTTRALVFSATISSPILIGSTVVCSSDAPSLSARV